MNRRHSDGIRLDSRFQVELDRRASERIDRWDLNRWDLSRSILNRGCQSNRMLQRLFPDLARHFDHCRVLRSSAHGASSSRAPGASRER